MKPASILLAAGVMAACPLLHAQSALTREQVKAEFEAARRNGDLIVAGEAGLTERQLHQDRYPARPSTHKAREEVRQELAQAMRNGDMPVGELGITPRDLRPDKYPHEVVAGKTREEVKLELAEAQRTGALVAVGETGQTYRELYPQRYAAQPRLTASSPREVGSGVAVR